MQDKGNRFIVQRILLGIFVALLLFALAWTLAQTEYRANRIAGRMTEEYRRSERRFRSAMHYSAIGKALLDSDGRIVEANPSLGRIVGRAPESMVGPRMASQHLKPSSELSP